MQVFIDSAAIESCKQEIQEFYQDKFFKEVGGYILGIYNGEDFQIKHFYLDKYAESTSVRIKLSVDAFHEVEQLFKQSPELMYIGTWHVHPGLDKPKYSNVDISTLFLERLVLDTDSPEEVNCPKIHIIFNSELTEYSCFIMETELEFLCNSLDSSIGGNIIQPELFNNGLYLLNESKELLKLKKVENYYKLQKNIEDVYDNLDSLSDQINLAIDYSKELIWYQEVEHKIEKVIKNAIGKGEKLGIIISEDKKKIETQKYRPSSIKSSFEEGTLVGFWLFIPYENINDIFLKLFYINFYKKINAEPGDIFLFFLVQKFEGEIDIQPFFLNFNSFNGISYIELETTLIE